MVAQSGSTQSGVSWCEALCFARDRDRICGWSKGGFVRRARWLRTGAVAERPYSSTITSTKAPMRPCGEQRGAHRSACHTEGSGLRGCCLCHCHEEGSVRVTLWERRRQTHVNVVHLALQLLAHVAHVARDAREELLNELAVDVLWGGEGAV